MDVSTFEQIPEAKRRLFGAREFASLNRVFFLFGVASMPELDSRTLANMDVVLEEACRIFPNGGDHETRKYIAEKLRLSAMEGHITLGALNAVAQSAIHELSKRSA